MAGLEVWPKLIYYADDSRLCPSLSANTYRLMSWLLVSVVMIFWCPDVNHQPRTRLRIHIAWCLDRLDSGCQMPFLRYFYVLDSVIFLRKRLATLLKKREDDNDTLFWCNVDASWQRRPHGMPLLKTNTTEQISLSYTAKYCQVANIIIIHRQILSRCKYHHHTPLNIVKVQI